MRPGTKPRSREGPLFRRGLRILALAIGAVGVAIGGLPAGLASAGEADVLEASAECTPESVCRFRVTVRHADEGWDHYANRWQVLTLDGKVITTRILRHPHVEEQPFTRGLEGVRVPANVEQVRIRAGDSVHGFGGREVTLSLER